MTPFEVTTDWRNGVSTALAEDGVDVLNADGPARAETASAWVRTLVTHLDEEPDFPQSGAVQQVVELTATVYSPQGESSRGEFLAEKIRKTLAHTKTTAGVAIGIGRFESVGDEDEESIDNFRALRVRFRAQYNQDR